MPFFALGFVGIATLGCVGLIWLVRRCSKNTQHQLSRALGVPDGSPLVVERNGRTFTAKYTRPSKNTPAKIRVTTSVDDDAKSSISQADRVFGRGSVDVRPYLVLRGETSFDRFGKRHGLTREIDIGDKDFDAAVFIESESREDVIRKTLADRALRQATRELIADKQRVVLGPKGLYAERPISTKKPEDFAIERTIERLGVIAAGLPVFKAGRADKQPWLFEVVLVIAFAVGTIATSVLTAQFAGPLGNEARITGFGGGFLLWLLMSLGAVVALRGHANSLRRISIFVGFTLILIPWGTYETLCWANRAWDTSPGTGHATKIVRAWTTQPKGKIYYHLEVTAWRPGESVLPLGVSATFAEKATVGRRIIVTTHQGRFGWEWIESFSLVRQQ
ncbi:MAG: hypothetical protein ABI583_11615 [Betaproteobacteria bacterium]